MLNSMSRTIQAVFVLAVLPNLTGCASTTSGGAVNVDRTPNDWLSYERILSQTKAPTKGLISVRQDDGKALPAKLPMTLLIDTKGKVVRRYDGRVAPEAWDDVAELLL